MTSLTSMTKVVSSQVINNFLPMLLLLQLLKTQQTSQHHLCVHMIYLSLVYPKTFLSRSINFNVDSDSGTSTIYYHRFEKQANLTTLYPHRTRNRSSILATLQLSIKVNGTRHPSTYQPNLGMLSTWTSSTGRPLPTVRSNTLYI